MPHTGEDVRWHVLCVWRGSRDLCITLGRIEAFLGDWRIVIQMDEVVCDTRVVRLSFEDRLQQRRSFELVGVSLISGRSRHVERNRVSNLCFVILRITLCHLFLRLQIILDARAMIDLVVIHVHRSNRINIILLALRFCAHCLPFWTASRPSGRLSGGGGA